MKTHYETVIVGGGISGLLTASILTQHGFDVLLVEREATLGGNNGSFRNKAGHYFDHGYHALDYGRSWFTTKLFEKVLHGRYRKVALRRGILIRENIIPSNGPVAHWPESLRSHLPSGEIVDTVGMEPSRENLANVYGQWMADLAYDELLPSYPNLKWDLEQGKEPIQLMGDIYPWFFPHAQLNYRRHQEWNQFHDQTRRTGEHMVLYPSEGGFGSFLDAIRDALPIERLATLLNVRDLKLEVDDSRRRIDALIAGGNKYTADRYFWCAPIAIIAREFGLKFHSGHPQVFALASYTFSEPVKTDYLEILVADPRLRINRISCPGKLTSKDDRQVQVEFGFPKDYMNVDAEDWDRECRQALVRFGIVSVDNAVEDRSIDIRVRGVVPTSEVRQALEDIKTDLRTKESNVVYPYIGTGGDNINRFVPTVFREVYAAITS